MSGRVAARAPTPPAAPMEGRWRGEPGRQVPSAAGRAGGRARRRRLLAARSGRPSDGGEPTSRQLAVLAGSWRGPAHTAFAAVVDPFLAALAAAVHPLHEAASGLEQLADGIEAAQAEYHQRMLAVGLTARGGRAADAADL